jgi:hypothetical protein
MNDKALAVNDTSAQRNAAGTACGVILYLWACYGAAFS